MDSAPPSNRLGLRLNPRSEQGAHGALVYLDYDIQIMGCARLALETRGDGAGDHVIDPDSLQRGDDSLQ